MWSAEGNRASNTLTGGDGLYNGRSVSRQQQRQFVRALSRHRRRKMIGRVGGIVLALVSTLVKRDCFEALFGNGFEYVHQARVRKTFPNDSIPFGQKIGGHQIQSFLSIFRVLLHEEDGGRCHQENSSIAVCLSIRRIGLEPLNNRKLFCS